MATQLQLRRGNTAQTAVFTGALAEVTVDTDKKTIIVHDGVTAGGYALALEQGSSAQAQAAYDKANSAFGQANLAFDAANSAVTTGQANSGAALIDAKSYTDTSNTNLKNYTDSTFLKLSSPSQTVTGNLILNGYVTIQNDLTISGNVTTINTIELNVADNEVVLNSDWDSSQVPTQNAGITINRGLYTNTFIRYDENNDYWVLRDNVEQYIIATTANVGAGDIAVTSAYQANVGAGLITVTGAYEANVGSARIADALAAQANVGAGLISVTSEYEANVGQLRLDTSNANNSLAANIGAARIADTAAAQANVGEAKIISLARADSAFDQANLAYSAANAAVTSGGARAFDQANLAFDKANSANILAQNAYDAANSAVTQGQANVGAGLITVTNAYQANVGAGLITVTNDYQANVGALRIDTNTANSSLAANIGASRIADQATSQANVGAGLIIVTNDYQANVGQLRLDTSNANNSLAANIGAARIADVAAGQANVGAGLITVTSAYQANVGDAKIIALGRADSAFAQANLAFDAANSKLSSSGGTISGDLAVTGNLTITGNTTTFNVSSLKVTDSIIQLAIDNQTDLLDIGFVGHYANTPNNHTGLIRKFTDGRYYLFDSYTPGTEPTNLIDIANTRVATLSANLVTNVITLRGLDPLDYANTIQTSAQANVGVGLISAKSTSEANVGSAIAQGQANVGAGLITVTNEYQANVGAGLITKVAKAGDTMTGSLSTSDSLIGLNLTANNILTVNTNSIYEATAVTTSTTAQVVLDSWATATYRSAKYLVQISSGSSYELLELTLIHDGTTVYLSQYGNIKTGATLGVFDATISAGTLSVLATPNNAITTFKTAATLIPI